MLLSVDWIIMGIYQAQNGSYPWRRVKIMFHLICLYMDSLVVRRKMAEHVNAVDVSAFPLLISVGFLFFFALFL